MVLFLRQWQAIKDFVYGLTGYEFARHALELKREREAIFMIITVGDLVGLPVLPPIYSLRLLPHMVPEVSAWRRWAARRRQFWERTEVDLHGV